MKSTSLPGLAGVTTAAGLTGADTDGGLGCTEDDDDDDGLADLNEGWVGAGADA